MAKKAEPEIGHMLFGCPSSEFECPEFIVAGLLYLATEIERVEWNITQKEYDAPFSNVGGEYKTDVFEVRGYYWGECDCGYEDAEWKWCETHPHEPDCFHAKYEAEEKRLEATGVDFNKRHKELEKFAKNLGYRTDMWGVAVHCDCYHEKDWQEWASQNNHKETCSSILPNFKCGDLEVRWYKYLGRDTTINMDIDANQFAKILDKCLDSVRRKEQCN